MPVVASTHRRPCLTFTSLGPMVEPEGLAVTDLQGLMDLLDQMGPQDLVITLVELPELAPELQGRIPVVESTLLHRRPSHTFTSLDLMVESAEPEGLAVTVLQGPMDLLDQMDHQDLVTTLAELILT